MFVSIQKAMSGQGTQMSLDFAGAHPMGSQTDHPEHYNNVVNHGIDTSSPEAAGHGKMFDLSDGTSVQRVAGHSPSGMSVHHVNLATGLEHGPEMRLASNGEMKMYGNNLNGEKHGPEYRWGERSSASGEPPRTTKNFDNGQHLGSHVAGVRSSGDFTLSPKSPTVIGPSAPIQKAMSPKKYEKREILKHNLRESGNDPKDDEGSAARTLSWIPPEKPPSYKMPKLDWANMTPEQRNSEAGIISRRARKEMGWGKERGNIPAAEGPGYDMSKATPRRVAERVADMSKSIFSEIGLSKSRKPKRRAAETESIDSPESRFGDVVYMNRRSGVRKPRDWEPDTEVRQEDLHPDSNRAFKAAKEKHPELTAGEYLRGAKALDKFKAEKPYVSKVTPSPSSSLKRIPRAGKVGTYSGLDALDKLDTRDKEVESFNMSEAERAAGIRKSFSNIGLIKALAGEQATFPTPKSIGDAHSLVTNHVTAANNNLYSPGMNYGGGAAAHNFDKATGQVSHSIHGMGNPHITPMSTSNGVSMARHSNIDELTGATMISHRASSDFSSNAHPNASEFEKIGTGTNNHGPQISHLNDKNWSYKPYHNGSAHGEEFGMAGGQSYQSTWDRGHLTKTNNPDTPSGGYHPGVEGVSKSVFSNIGLIKSKRKPATDTKHIRAMMRNQPSGVRQEYTHAGNYPQEIRENLDRTKSPVPPDSLKDKMSKQPSGTKVMYHPHSEEWEQESTDTLKDKMSKQPSGTKKTYTTAPGFDGKSQEAKFRADDKAWDGARSDRKRYGTRAVEDFNQAEAERAAGVNKSVFSNIGLIKASPPKRRGAESEGVGSYVGSVTDQTWLTGGRAYKRDTGDWKGDSDTIEEGDLTENSKRGFEAAKKKNPKADVRDYMVGSKRLERIRRDSPVVRAVTNPSSEAELGRIPRKHPSHGRETLGKIASEKRDIEKFNRAEAERAAGVNKSVFSNIGLIKSKGNDEDLADRVIGEDKPDLEKMQPVATPPQGGTPPSITAPMPSGAIGKSMFERKHGSQIKRFSSVGKNCGACGVLIKSLDGPCPSCAESRKGVRWHEGHLA